MTSDNKENSETLKKLKSALLGLLYTSESDYPLDYVWWEKAPGKTIDCNLICEQLGQGADTKIKEGDAKALLEDCCKIEEWFGENERKMAQGYQQLRDMLNQHVKNLKRFDVGETEVIVVLVGEDESGNIVGFKTISVET